MSHKARIKEFCNDLLEWINEGCPTINPYNFSQRAGVCTLYRWWALKKHPNDVFVSLFSLHTFEGTTTDDVYPFNLDEADYEKEQNKYTNPARLNWIKEHAK